MSCLTCACLVLLMVAATLAYPWSDASASPSSSQSACDTQDDIQILCQRCAKATKSNIVYPMCCEDQEEARNWCFQYISFGIQGP